MSSTVEKYKHASVIKCVRSIQFDAIANSDQKWPLSIQEGVLLPTVCMVMYTSHPNFLMYFVGVVALADLRRSLMSGWVGRMGGWVGGEDGWQESGILQRIYVKVQQFTKREIMCNILLLLFHAVLTVKFISTHYRVEEGDGSVEVCAQMVGLNSKKVVINMSTNASTAKRTSTKIHLITSMCLTL